MSFLGYIIFILILESSLVYGDESENVTLDLGLVTRWAKSLGNELRSLGTNVTQLDDLKAGYTKYNASVLPTDGKGIVHTIVSKINQMVEQKIRAVTRIKETVENAEFNGPVDENFTYFSSKFSPAFTTENASFTEHTVYTVENQPVTSIYRDVFLSGNRHFYDIPVNTTYSSVHIPTNTYDNSTKLRSVIRWSEKLDDIFVKNYEYDPSLIWQYFGSTTGMLRHFPAFHWKVTPDMFDSRSRIWYVRASTCSKEAVILIDTSGSMYGMKNTIAQMTVDSLLNTMGTNDYLNVYAFNNAVYPIVPCFDNMLVQATTENLNLFRSAVFDLCPREKLNYVNAFKKAFDLFRQSDREAASAKVIFLLTDIVPPELPEVYNVYDKFYREHSVMIDLFIYFIGIDVPNIRRIQWDKCLGNGSIVHVRTMDEIKEDTLKYIPVIERIRNNYVKVHPVTWTHVYVDVEKDKGVISPPICAELNKTNEQAQTNEYHFVVSASTPVYSIRNDSQAYDNKMLGVAGIDIDLTDFQKLTMPFKIGVNGYAFIITNNGYVLFHPDLRKVSQQNSILQDNFNSVDLTEVEFFDDDVDIPREPNVNITTLRERMVNQESGEIEKLAIKFHYDNMKRVGSEARNYIYAPLRCTPYTLGLSLPTEYGNYWIKTSNEIEESQNRGENYSNYFTGNWKVHPKWVYCNYIGRRQNDFNSPEDKLLHFLSKIFNENDTWKWQEQYPTNGNINLTFDSTANSKDNCTTGNTEEKKIPQDYFCVKELLELVFFDAKLTQLYNTPFLEPPADSSLAELIRENNVTVRFLATQGGLTRWQDTSKDLQTGFGEYANQALDEAWYKSAVLLQHLDSDSFVFSLPSEKITANSTLLNDTDVDNRVITASHAVFYEQGKSKAPGFVVGYEFTYAALFNKLKSITKGSDHRVRCSPGALDCYIIDANGYIVVSMQKDEVGQFSGEVEGLAPIMEQMIAENIFRQITLFNYQAFCEEEKQKDITTSAAGNLLTSWVTHCYFIVHWLITNIIWYFIQIGLSLKFDVFADKEVQKGMKCQVKGTGYEDKCQTREIMTHLVIPSSDDDKPNIVPCDEKFDLYLFQNLSADGYTPKKVSATAKCSRPFFVTRIDYTNLLLVVVDPDYQTCVRRLSINPIRIKYNTSYGDIRACHKANVTYKYPKKQLCGTRDLNSTQGRYNESCDKVNGVRSIYGLDYYFVYTLMVVIHTIDFYK